MFLGHFKSGDLWDCCYIDVHSSASTWRPKLYIFWPSFCTPCHHVSSKCCMELMLHLFSSGQCVPTQPVAIQQQRVRNLWQVKYQCFTMVPYITVSSVEVEENVGSFWIMLDHASNGRPFFFLVSMFGVKPNWSMLSRLRLFFTSLNITQKQVSWYNTGHGGILPTKTPRRTQMQNQLCALKCWTCSRACAFPYPQTLEYGLQMPLTLIWARLCINAKDPPSALICTKYTSWVNQLTFWTVSVYI